MGWTLRLYRLDTGERYGPERKCPSADACKRWAKEWHRMILGGPSHVRPPDLLAQILDPTGWCVFYAEIRHSGSWRLTWHFGSGTHLLPEPPDELQRAVKP